MPADASAMSQASAAQALQALSRSDSARTKAARLRELLPEIEAAQAAGVKHEHILAALNAYGFALSMKSYSVMLYRLRQQRAKNPGAQAPAAPPSPGPMAAVAATGASPAHATAAAPSQPGQPQRFDWEALKSAPPEW